MGNPPSFTSVTRDTYPTDKTFSIQFIKNVLISIASACVHLHIVCGLMHSDLYAHNILTKSDGTALLSDFGGASFTSAIRSSNEKLKNVFNNYQIKNLEKLEVRAFGCLIEELVERVDELSKSDHYNSINKLISIKDKCMNEVVDNRPDFNEIFELLNMN